MKGEWQTTKARKLKSSNLASSTLGREETGRDSHPLGTAQTVSTVPVTAHTEVVLSFIHSAERMPQRGLALSTPTTPSIAFEATLRS